MSTKTDPRPIDQYGVEHRRDCDLPEPTIKASTIPGRNLQRCLTCGAQQLTRRSVTL